MPDGAAAASAARTAGATARSATAGASPAASFRPGRPFLVLSVLFGVPLALLVAPFQAPDESGHFLRAYQVSEGRIVPVRRGRQRGGELPTSLTDVIGHFSGMKPPRHARTSRRQIEAALRVPLNPGERSFMPFVASIYSPVAYLPQAAAIAAGRAFGLHPLALMYLGRVANLMVWIALGYAAIRAAPDLGRPLLLLLLMPMSIFQAASLSADATTNGLAALLAAVVWRYATAGTRPAGATPVVEAEPAVPPTLPRAARLGWPALLALGALTATISLTKFAYVPLAALVLLIPASRLGGTRRYCMAMAAVLAVNVAALAAWAPQTGGLDTVVRPDARVSPRRQLDYLSAHPTAMITVPVETFLGDGMFLVKSFVGRLGSVDIALPAAFILVYLASLIAACWPGDRDQPPPPRLSQLSAVVLVATTLSVAAIGLLNYLYWTPVGSRSVDGLQGRYLIPLAPAALLLIRGLFWRPSRRHGWDWRTRRRLDAAAAGMAVIADVYTLAAVYVRYYGPGWPHWRGGG
jgi:hypothetical protein